MLGQVAEVSSMSVIAYLIISSSIFGTTFSLTPRAIRKASALAASSSF